MKLVQIFLLCFLSGSVLAQKKNSPSKKQESTPPQEIKLKPAPLPIHSMGDHWSGVREADGVSTYKLKSNPKVIGTFHLQKQEKIDLKELKQKDFFKKFTWRKEEWLRVIGIQEWKADSHSLKKRKDFMELNIKGSYKRSSGRQVFFKERQLFFPDSVYQILVIGPEKKTLQKGSVRSFFKKAQKIGIQKRKGDQRESRS